MGDTPVPIPNTTVKTQAADGTALETVWESRWAPDQKKKTGFNLLIYIQALESELCKNIAEKVEIRGFPMLTRPAGKCCCDNWFYQ